MASLWIETKSGSQKLSSGPAPVILRDLRRQLAAREKLGAAIEIMRDGTVGALLVPKGELQPYLLYVELCSPPTRDLEIGQPRFLDGKGVVRTKAGVIPIGAADA